MKFFIIMSRQRYNIFDTYKDLPKMIELKTGVQETDSWWIWAKDQQY